MLVGGGPRRWPGGASAWSAPGEARLVVLAGVAIVGGVGGFWAFASGASSSVWVPVLVLAGLLLVSIPICMVVAWQDTKLQKLLVLALILKLLFVFVRFGINENVYDGSADAGRYHAAGQAFYLNMHEEGRWSIDGSQLVGSDETKALGYVTGVVYLIVGPTELGGFLAFSWLAWIGLLCFFKAFRVAYPNAPPYLAAGLIFFVPSVLYWPSSIGKDAIMVACLGVLTLGVARMLTPSRPLRGLVLVVPAAALILQIRPHLLMIVLVGGAASMLARSSGDARTMMTVAGRALLLIVAVPALLIGLTRMDETFGDGSDRQGGQEQSGFSVSDALDRTERQTTTGGSSFETRSVQTPIDLPVATVNVLYRPFLFEAGSPTALMSALEGTFLLVMTFAAGRWVWRMVLAARSHAFVAFCVAYVVAFIFAFSNVANAGIVARQRVQMLPLLMLAVAVAREHHRVHVESKADATHSTGNSAAIPPRPEPRELATT